MIKRLFFHVLVATLVVACTASGTGNAVPTTPSDWQDIPIMPDAVASNESMTVTGYQYTINADIKIVERFYLNEMKNSGWELLGEGDMSRQDFKAFDLWFVKGDKIVTIEIWVKNNVTHVVLVPEP